MARVASREGRSGERRLRLGRFAQALTLVVLPLLSCAIYFFMLAANRYELEARFVVRSASSALMGEVAGLLQGANITRASDEAYIAHSFMTSREGMDVLVREAGLLEKLAHARMDLLWSYPGLLGRHTEEKLYKQLKSLIDIHYDSTTGISTLRVQAFRPEDAQEIAAVLLRSAEQLINRMSERSQRDAVEQARAEVDLGRLRALEAQQRVTNFRASNKIIDPVKFSTSAQGTIARLSLEKALAQAQLIETDKSSPQSPQADVIRVRISSLDAQILKERTSLAGTDGALAPLMAEYEGLILEREFAERAFASALVALESARVDAQRQRLYLELVSKPSRADVARYPFRAFNLLASFLVLIACYSILRRIQADLKAHGGK